MAMAYATAVRTARMQVVADAIDQDVGAGTLEIGTSGFGSVLAIMTLADPCGTVTNGVLTFDVTPALEDASANNTGTAAEARIKDNSGDIIISGLTVGTSGTHIILTSTAIVATEPVTITSFTITEGNA
jgi:hypothetical protein